MDKKNRNLLYKTMLVLLLEELDKNTNGLPSQPFLCIILEKSLIELGFIHSQTKGWSIRDMRLYEELSNKMPNKKYSPLFWFPHWDFNSRIKILEQAIKETE